MECECVRACMHVSWVICSLMLVSHCLCYHHIGRKTVIHDHQLHNISAKKAWLVFAMLRRHHNYFLEKTLRLLLISALPYHSRAALSQGQHLIFRYRYILTCNLVPSIYLHTPGTSGVLYSPASRLLLLNLYTRTLCRCKSLWEDLM